MKKTLAVLVLLLVPIAAWAVTPNDWTSPCGTDTVPETRPNQIVASTDHACFKFDENHNTTGTGIGNSLFHVKAPRARVSLIRDLNATGGTVIAELRRCLPLAPFDASRCAEVVATFSVDASEPVERGVYLLNVTTAVAATEDALLLVQGYE